MPQVTASTSRAHLRSSTAIVAAHSPRPLRRNWRGQAMASAVLALAGTGILALPNIALAQDINLGIAGETYDISAAGNQIIGTLDGVAGTTVILGENRLTTEASRDAVFAGIISGNGSLNKSGSGILTLSGINTYSGPTYIAGGTLAIAGDGTLGYSSLVDLYATGASFDISAANADQNINRLTGVAGSAVRLGANDLAVTTNSAAIFRGVISGTGGLIKNGTSTFTISGDNTYTGATVVNAGTLQIGLNGTSGSVAGDITNNASLIFSRSDDFSYGGVISGTGRFIMSGSGTLTLTGNNTHTGTTEIFQGTLALGAGGSLNSSSAVNLTSARAKFDISAAYAPQTIGSLQGVAGTSVTLGSYNLTTNSAQDTTFAGVISGSGGINISGGGTVTLEGDNTYSGITTIQNADLQLGNGGTTGSVAGDIFNNGNLHVNRSDALSYGGVISGNGNVTNIGTGTLTLTGVNTYSGITEALNGTIAIGAGGSISNTRKVQLSNSGAKFDISASSGEQTIGGLSGVAGTEVILGSRTLNIDQSTDLDFSGVISGTGGIAKSGNGILSLGGNNTFTGRVDLYSGTLAVSGGGSLDGNRIDLRGPSTLDISGANSHQTVGMLTGFEDGRILLGANNLTVNVDGYTAAYFHGTISGTGTLIKADAGQFALTSANAVSGPIEIAGGALMLANDGSLSSSSSIFLSGAGTRFRISWAYNDQTIGSLSGVAGSEIVLGSKSLTVNQTANGTFAGVIDGTAGLIKDGAAILTLSGANTYTGTTVINAGTLALGSSGSLPTYSAVSLTGAGARLDVSTNGPNRTIAGLAGVAGSEVAVSARDLYINQSEDSSFGGVISGTGTIAKLGMGNLYLTGENTYSGGTVVNAGTLSIGNGGTTGSVVSSIDNYSSVVFNRSDDFSYAGNIAGSGQVTKSGAGTLTLTGQHTYNGGTLVSGGTLQFGSVTGGSRSILGGVVLVAEGGTLGFHGAGAASVRNSVTLQKDATLSIHAGAATPSLTANNLVLGQNTTFNLSGIGSEAQLPLTLIETLGGINGDFAKVTVGGFAGSVDYMSVHTGKSADGLSYVANYGLSWTAANNLAHGTFTLTDATNSFTLGTALSDQTANAATGWNGTHLTKAGAGTLILTGNNTYTGGTTISGGTLQLGEGGTTGSVIGAIANDGVLAINRSDTLTFANTVSGSGQLEHRGSGTLIVTGTNSYAGGTRVLGGTLSVSDNANLGAASGGIELDGGALQITGTTFATLDRDVALGTNGGAIDIADPNNILTVTADITGGNLTKRGFGTLNLTGNNRFEDLRVESGNVNSTLSSIAGDIALTGTYSTLNLMHTDTTYSGVISGNGQMAFNGNGTTVLTGDSSGFRGVTRLYTGSLIVGTQQDQAKLGGSLALGTGALLGGSGTIGSGAGSIVTIGTGATLSPGNSIGTLTIDGDLTLWSGSFLNVELGAAGSALGNASTNDRVDVTGNLTLGGTLNLSQSANASDGTAGFGYYRIATYGGSLVNNGLEIGTTPAVLNGADYQLLTTTAGAVDLFIASIGDQTLQHWQGGDGVWNNASTQWLNRDGQLAASWGGNHAIFRNTLGGTITVEGNQSFEGLQFVDNGFSLIGSGALVTDADGSEIRVLANSASIATAITGAGGITKTQAGTLILSGTNTYAGGTTIAGGTVSVSQYANLGAASGGVTLNGGTLQITGTDFGTLSRNVTIGTNGGAIDVADQAHTLTVASAISGGNLIKRGAGTLALSGTNTHGQTSIEGGTLSGSLANMGTSVSLSDGATLQLNQSGEFAYNGAFSGLGDIVINGDGTTLLTADSAGFTGHTFMNGGSLLIGNAQSAGRLGGSLDVASGATLGGSGIIGSGAGSLVTIGSGAILSPGNSIGTLMINGDLKFENGARYVVEVNPLGTDSDKLIVTGTATLNGGTVAHIGATGTYNPRSTYTIVDAGTLTGAFGSVTSDFAFLNPSLSYDYAAGTVELELVRNDRDFASTAQTRNQIATANAIESIGFAAGHAVYDAVVQLADDTAEIRRSFDQLSGELQSSVRSAQIEDSRFVRNAANDRLRAAFGQSVGGDGPALAYAANGAQVAVDATYEGAAFWAQSYGSWGSFDADAGTIELDRHIGGALLGGDVRMSNWRVGVLAGYSQSEVKTERQSATSDNNTLGLYAGSQWGKASLRLALAQSWHDVDTKRSVQMTGLSDYLQADYSATTRQVFVEAGYALISRERNHLEAFANLAQVRARTDAFSETGGAASLNLAKADADVTFTTLGLRGSRQIALGETAGVLRGSAGWRNASGDTSAEGLHAFSAGDAFTVTGAPIAKDAAVIETGMDVRFNARTTFSLTYTGQIADAANDHGFNARLSFSF